MGKDGIEKREKNLRESAGGNYTTEALRTQRGKGKGEFLDADGRRWEKMELKSGRRISGRALGEILPQRH